VIEGVFGEAKSFHLLQRALFRGKVKLRIQLLLTAAVLNLKRLLSWQPRRTAAFALPRVVSKFITSKIDIIRNLLVYSAPALES